MMPDAGADPYEEGLDAAPRVEAIPTADSDEDRAAASDLASNANLASNTFSAANVQAAAAPVAVSHPAFARPNGPTGNASVATTYDPTPVTAEQPASRSSHTSALARAFAESR